MSATYLPTLAGLWWPDVFRGYVVHTTSPRKHAPTRRKAEDRSCTKQFIEQASKLYADALVHDNSEVSTLVNVYARIGRMRVLSSDAVIEGAEAVVRKIIDTYFSPNRTFPELRELMNSSAMDPLREFSEACRNELRALKPS